MSIAETVVGVVAKVLDRVLPDKAQAAQLAAEVTKEILANETAINAAAGQVITAEAQSQFWLTSNWRPLTMMVFVFIIANNYIIAPYVMLFFHVQVALDTPPDLWDLIKIGMGGYVIGRSAEKAIATWKAG